MRLLIAFTALLWTAAATPPLSKAAAKLPQSIDDVLQHQTQELLDAVSDGKAAVWERYLDDRATLTAEDGSVSTKAEIVKQIKPLPEGVSGVLKVTDFKAFLHGSVAVTNYVADEEEKYYGHQLHCQYRSTDTWLKGAKGWRLIAQQTIALRTDPPSMPLAQPDAYVGQYALTPTIAYEIRRTGDKLEGRRTGREWEILLAEAPDVLFTPGKPRYRKIFQRNASGEITGFAERREAWDLVWQRKP